MDLDISKGQLSQNWVLYVNISFLYMPLFALKLGLYSTFILRTYKVLNGLVIYNFLCTYNSNFQQIYGAFHAITAQDHVVLVLLIICMGQPVFS
jgi:hypothetical protein